MTSRSDRHLAPPVELVQHGEAEPTQERVCATHGPYMAGIVDPGPYFAKRWTDCPGCRDAWEAEQAELLAQRRLRMVEQWLATSGMRGRFQRASFDTFGVKTSDQRDALKACRDFAERVCAGETGTLFLIGPPGTGKTHLACAILRAVIEQTAERGAFTTVADLIRSIRSTWGSRERDNNESTVIAGFVTPRLLVLDDVGSNLGSESEQRHLLDVIDGRYVEERPIVVTSNLTAEEMKNSVGERAFDRLRERGRRVVCAWPSYRRSGGHE